jgi:DNA invertase Pin-like site-specific DNA recombinase
MAYSTDLREKITRAYDDGLGSQRAIAELFGVSRSFVEKLLPDRAVLVKDQDVLAGGQSTHQR